MAKEGTDGQEKTEQPTGRRKSKARSEGQVAKSQEINMVAGLFAALLYFALQGPVMLSHLQELSGHFFFRIHEYQLTIVSTVQLIRDLVNSMFLILLPYMLILFAVAVFSNIAQIGFLFTLKPFKPKLSKFNTIKGLKKKFSWSGLIRILRSIGRLAIILWVPYLIIKSEIVHMPLLMDVSISEILNYLGMLLLKIFFYTGLVLLLLALIDFIYQRWKHNRDLKMSKQEVKDEHKQSEGDPKIKAQIRRLQMQMLRKIMLDSVKKSDVVITNPVHYAVALKYDRNEMAAPTVVAKGARKLAEKIKSIARMHGVPVVENKPLAQMLYAHVDVGEAIPENLYKAVAEILAYVFTRKSSSAAHSAY
jgi:flagellar biosynthesis protein FlhB